MRDRAKKNQRAEGGRVKEVSGFTKLSALLLLLLSFSALSFLGCRGTGSKQSVQPRTMRDVPAERLAYSLEPDVSAPQGAATDEGEILEPIKNDFDTRRQSDALVRTVPSPDGQRTLALYETD